MFRNTITLYLFLFFSGCVSVKLANNGTNKKYDKVEYSNPGKPFIKIENSPGDNSWMSSKTQSVIGFLSDCTNPDADLKSLEADSVSSVDNPEVRSSEYFDFNGRRALESQILGKVDGVSIFLNLVIFKKSDCSFVLSYSGKRKNESTEKEEFKIFLKGFQVN